MPVKCVMSQWFVDLIEHSSCFCDAVPGCGMPLAERGGREGSYLKINPQIQTVVQSLSIICKSLNEAPREWWNMEEKESGDEEEDEDEIVDLQHYSPTPSKRGGTNCNSPEDSEQTEAFGQPANFSPLVRMDAIEEDSSPINRSCALPSQSPNFSPIAHLTSQEVNDHEQKEGRKHVDNEENDRNLICKKKESPVVHFQEKATTITPISTVPTVLVASALRSQDSKMLDTLLDGDKIKLHPMEEEMTADYAICGNAELETGDGYVVGRTYGYLLAVASGIPIVNISYLESSVDKMPNGKHQVIGDVDSSEWMAPQRAMSSRRSGGGTTLLDGYTILLYGDFDPEPKTSKRSRSGAAKDVPKTHSTYSAGRFEQILRTCGATVLRDKESFKRIVATTPNDKVAVMLRANPHPRDWRAATKDLEDYPTLPVICGNWLLDSIGNFYVKAFSDYTHASCKK
jgi:hypothetical protein